MQNSHPPPELTTKLGYARVSTADQDLRLQIDALVRDGVPLDHIYRETVSGASRRRPEFRAMMRDIRAGDIIVVWKLDRLARSLKGLLDIVDEIQRRGAQLRIITQQIDTTTASGRAFMQMLGVISEFEREIGRERTIAGLASARSHGHVGGRRKTYTDEQIGQAAALRQDRGYTWKDAARSIGISVPRLQARIRELRESEERCPTN